MDEWPIRRMTDPPIDGMAVWPIYLMTDLPIHRFGECTNGQSDDSLNGRSVGSPID